MKTQISRNAHDPSKRYTGVFQQQGRMIADADWNALGDIVRQQLTEALAELVAGGGPRDAALALNADRSLRPGVVYAGGLRAELAGDGPVGLTSQPDYPDPPTLPAGDLLVYVDLWERSVTALEDPDLMDPGLHGADTTTRRQQMLQVKWVDSGSIADTALIPPQGSSALALSLRRILVGSDPCDPCASEVDLDERVGNYLFRVEVHDVFVDGGDTHVTLKWSRDNGAEAYPADNIPTGFDVGDWVWEFFDADSEKTAGRHFPAGYRPRRGALRASFSPPAGGEPADFVRQWDGYAVVNVDTDALVEGMDRGVQLSDAVSADAHGFSELADGELTVNGELMLMRWRYRQAGGGLEAFLAGDFWQAEVREAVREPGDYVLGSATGGAVVQGIRHHYLALARVDAGGNVLAYSDEEQRRFNFPPLTDLRAADVGFSNTCPSLYGSAANVQQALAALCDIGADDIAWKDPECPDSVRELLADALSAWPDLDGDGRVSVADALAALFCELRATHLPLDKSDPGLCELLQAESVRSVQDALQVLCEQGRGGCAIPVNPGEQLMELLKVFAANEEAAELWLCLRPGEHRIEADFTLAGKEGLKLVGAGRDSSVLRFEGDALTLQAAEIHLEDIGLFLADSAASVTLRAATLSACHCSFDRATGIGPAERPLLSWEPDAGRPDDASILWQDNRMSSYWRRNLVDPGRLAPTEVVGERLGSAVAALFGSETLLADEAAMREATRAVAKDIVALSAREKNHWTVTVGRNVEGFGRERDRPVRPGRGGTVNRGGGRVRPTGLARRPVRPQERERPLASNGEALAALAGEAINGSSAAEVAERLDDLVASAVAYEYNAVLSIGSADHRGSIRDNQLYGDLYLLAAGGKRIELGATGIEGVFSEVVDPVRNGGELALQNNHLHRLVTLIESGAVTQEGDDARRLLRAQVQAYGHLVVTGNTLVGRDHSLIGDSIHCDANTFPETVVGSAAGVALCRRGIYTANLGQMDADQQFRIVTADKNGVLAADNLMRFGVIA